MKVYTVKGFTGHYPVGTAAVIVAESEQMAVARLLAILAAFGLPQDEAPSVEELDTDEPSVRILCDGNY